MAQGTATGTQGRKTGRAYRETTVSDEAKRLYRKYRVTRIDDATGKHDGCEFFVLDWMHDRFAVPAIRAYADACAAEFPLLATELRYLAIYYENRHAEGSLPPRAPKGRRTT